MIKNVEIKVIHYNVSYKKVNNKQKIKIQYKIFKSAYKDRD